jgi:hypothetical protein
MTPTSHQDRIKFATACRQHFVATRSVRQASSLILTGPSSSPADGGAVGTYVSLSGACGITTMSSTCFFCGQNAVGSSDGRTARAVRCNPFSDWMVYVCTNCHGVNTTSLENTGEEEDRVEG